ncbi:L-ascorbate metabolism protein UlaG (beta-lactamase superfamily) [Gillisia mitskevichiae]|uniref:L-ascorbate metabolism protein UlaG (Beta-lactamase superfamily) n=1 Tax=Gillisia mitskevichiae TaxID=270921 RepID=A0A495PTV7_9FLAO|nr:MBL fold metallo-hydrolase [Gillisia mitskevichiae]RKS53657.1 L-ascorbate metabolism protein UlaG (beta-lactamase superfamily) [Gillisia mitskevichiae]
MIIGILVSIIGMIVLIAIIFIKTSPEFGSKSNGERLTKIQASENYRDGKFQNLTATDVSGDINYTKTLSEFFTKGDKVPDWSIPINKISSETIANTADSTTKITWFGHSALLLEMDGKKIFLDPMLGNVPAPHPLLGSKRFNDTLPLAIENIPDLDAVIISHDHYDHLDYGSIKKLKDRVAHFYVPLGVGAHLISWGVQENKITEMDWWESISFSGIQLTATPSRHFSGRGITDRFSTQWSSWVIKGQKDNIYFSGDSGYESHFKEIGDKFGPFDLAIMECGQYDAQWPLIHMMPEETVQATLDVKAEILLPIHWGAFKLGLHSWTDPIERITAEASSKNVNIATPIIGEAVTVGKPIPTSKWWKSNN